MEIKTVLRVLEDVMHYQLFTVNQTPITISSLLIFFATLASIYLINTIIREILGKRVLTRLRLSESTHFTLLRLAQYVLWFIGGIVAFQFIGIDLSGLAVIFGFLSLGIGFGLQNLTSNFVSGLILLFEQPIRIGDRVTVGDIEGDVLEINFRSTTIRSLNNLAIIVPNSDFISGTVINWSHGDPRTRLEIDVGVSYGSNLDLVLQSLLAVGREHPQVLSTPEPEVLFTSFGESAWNLRLWVWVGTPKRRRRVTSEIYCGIVTKFRENGVEIPFPQRDLHWRTPPVPLAANQAVL
jgi:small-conductance mechanosensitive channel